MICSVCVCPPLKSSDFMVVIVWAGLEADLNGTHTCCCCFIAIKSSCAFLRAITNKRYLLQPRDSILVPPARNLTLDRDANKGNCFPLKPLLSNISITNCDCLQKELLAFTRCPNVSNDEMPRVWIKHFFWPGTFLTIATRERLCYIWYNSMALV